MNYGFLDAHNLAWKLHLVEHGFMKRAVLQTYEDERRHAAERLIEFDATYASLFSSFQASGSHPVKDGGNAEFVSIFKQNSRLTSGYGVEYPPGCLNLPASKSASFDNPETKLHPGHSFSPATVTRVVDACLVHLEQDIPFNGSYRIYIFAGNPLSTSQALTDLSTHLQGEGSILSRFQQENVDTTYDSRHNPHSPFFSFSVIFSAKRSSIEIHDLPEYLACYRYHIYTDDVQSTEKWSSSGQGAVHAKMGFDSEQGGVAIVRPDGYIGCVLSLQEGSGTGDGLNEYFSGIVVDGGIQNGK